MHRAGHSELARHGVAGRADLLRGDQVQLRPAAAADRPVELLGVEHSPGAAAEEHTGFQFRQLLAQPGLLERVPGSRETEAVGKRSVSQGAEALPDGVRNLGHLGRDVGPVLAVIDPIEIVNCSPAFDEARPELRGAPAVGADHADPGDDQSRSPLSGHAGPSAAMRDWMNSHRLFTEEKTFGSISWL